MDMNPPKLKPWHIWAIALGVIVLACGAAAKFKVMPLMAQNKQLASDVQSLQDQGSDANQKAADKQLADANATVARTKAQWAKYENRYFRIGPSNQVLDLTDPLKAVFLLSRENAETLGPKMERWLRSMGATASVSVPAAPVDPNQIPKDVITVPFSGVKVSGNFDSIMRFLRSTRSAPRLITVNSVSLSSGASQDSTGETTAPRITAGRINTVTADVDLTVWLFPRNGKNAGKYTLPAGAEQAGGAGGVAAPGGPAGPMPGAPGMPGGPMRPGMPGGPARP